MSDSKCVLYALNLPCMLRHKMPLPDLQIMLPLLDQIVEVAIENLKLDQTVVNTLDLDLLINEDERINNTSFVSVLTALCH